MIGKIKLLSNYGEIEEYNEAVKEHGAQEAFNLGLYSEPPKEKFVSKEFLFKLQDVSTAWMVGNRNELINIKMESEEVWTLHYDEELWNKLRKHFKE